MQSVSSRVWTRVAMSISYDDNHYTTGTSVALFSPFSFRVRVSKWRWITNTTCGIFFSFLLKPAPPVSLNRSSISIHTSTCFDVLQPPQEMANLQNHFLLFGVHKTSNKHFCLLWSVSSGQLPPSLRGSIESSDHRRIIDSISNRLGKS